MPPPPAQVLLCGWGMTHHRYSSQPASQPLACFLRSSSSYIRWKCFARLCRKCSVHSLRSRHIACSLCGIAGPQGHWCSEALSNCAGPVRCHSGLQQQQQGWGQAVEAAERQAEAEQWQRQEREQQLSSRWRQQERTMVGKSQGRGRGLAAGGGQSAPKASAEGHHRAGERCKAHRRAASVASRQMPRSSSGSRKEAATRVARQQEVELLTEMKS